MDLVWGPTDREQAAERLREILGIQGGDPLVVLDMQMWRLTKDARDQLAAKAGHVCELLGRGITAPGSACCARRWVSAGVEHVAVHAQRARPVLQGVLRLVPARLPGDVLAGSTLATLGIPDVLGNAKIAGMPVTGLYTILLPMAVFALLGSSRHMVVGADSATAVILAVGSPAWLPAATSTSRWRALPRCSPVCSCCSPAPACGPSFPPSRTDSS
jgi:Sulfate permease family